jgi:benzoyl-CoA reductase/2-hydroxyglutaryl-CoA dehydratase subunit BcrC/BadD/HgdB
MSRINPYFELNGNRFEIKRTRWLFAEYNKLIEENPISQEDKANTMKASTLISDAKRFAEKTKECWDKLCKEPSEENQRIYLMFKGMSDKAIADYNDFVVNSNSLDNANQRTSDILEKVTIKALAEQYFGMNETLAKQTWEQYVDSVDNHGLIYEWLVYMSECLFAENSEVEDNSFLSQMRKQKEERENNRKNASNKKG